MTATIETLSWVSQIPAPVSLTMRDYDHAIPLHRVDADTAIERRRDEDRRIRAVKGRVRLVDSNSEWVDTTIERLAHAVDAGLIADSHEILSPSGFSTKARYRKIDDPIEVAFKRGWIAERHFMAGAKFFGCVHAAIRQPRLISSMEPSVDGSKTSNSMSDRRLVAQNELRRALRALPQKYRDPFFSWTIASLSGDVSVMSLGSYFSRARRADNVNETGKRKLLEILTVLAKHYGY